MGVVKRRQCPDALEFLGPDFDLAETFGVVEMGRGAVGHGEKNLFDLAGPYAKDGVKERVQTRSASCMIAASTLAYFSQISGDLTPKRIPFCPSSNPTL
jgi:hypothetical protein